ncbi:MAG TPA: DUF3105 domain-containing protein [Candidatus Limnocylindria bacterium]|nr:DUF3105 domain-containing protein [Candidatus Limnocylindria bacterium]
MAKRRTANVQRRRASASQLQRRLDAPSPGIGAVDWRIWLLAGLAAAAVVAVVIWLLLAGSGPSPFAGRAVADDGGAHIPQCEPGNYSSNPPTSGCHNATPGEWGVYETPLDPTVAIHNLEHGGIVIWYDAEELAEPAVQELRDYVNTQVSSTRYKVILSPWDGEPLDTPIAVTAWRYVLNLDEPNIDAIRQFLDTHYGRAPEPNGGPGPPAV